MVDFKYIFVAYLILIMFLANGVHFATLPFSYQERESFSELSLSKAEKYPILAIEFDKSIQFKLTSRKFTYRAQDFISLDITLVNISQKPIYTLIPNQPKFYCKTITGKKVDILPYFDAKQAITPKSFTFLTRYDYLPKDFLFLIECDPRAFKVDDDMPSSKILKQKDVYINYGEGCINISRPGKYVIQAEIDNDFVVIDPTNKEAKTTVGIIKSTPLIITVTN